VRVCKRSPIARPVCLGGGHVGVAASPRRVPVGGALGGWLGGRGGEPLGRTVGCRLAGSEGPAMVAALDHVGGATMVRIALLALLWLLPLSPALAEKRVALVIGVDTYDNLGANGQLNRARSDARAVARVLKDIGFDVTAQEDVARSSFNSHWQDFLNKLAPGDTAAFYFAGHGVEFSGRTYLLPRDVPNLKPGRDELLRREALSLQEFLADLKEKGTRLNLVILDACRENPFEPVAGRAVGGRRGLAITEPPEGTFIMYSAGSGETALDVLNDADRDPNSVYTRHLLPLLKTPGLTLTEVAEQVRVSVRQVAATVQHRQTPAYYNQVLGRVCVAGGDCGEAERAWALMKDKTSIPALEAFIRRFGDTYYGDLAKVRLAELKQAEVVKQVEAAKKKADDDARGKAAAETAATGPTPELSAGARLPRYPVVQAGGLFGEQDAKRLQSLADKHRLPLPDFRLQAPHGDVPGILRGFVGVWIDPSADARKRRTNMLIVEGVDKEGRADGWWVYGPPGATSSFPGDPANAFKFAGTITDKSLRFTSPSGQATYKNRLTSDGRMDHFWSHTKAGTSHAVLIPVWTLVDAERPAKKAPEGAKKKADVEAQAKRIAGEAAEYEQKRSREPSKSVDAEKSKGDLKGRAAPCGPRARSQWKAYGGWGAIAAGATSCGFSYGYYDKTTAEFRALDECKKKTSDCRIVEHSQ